MNKYLLFLSILFTYSFLKGELVQLKNRTGTVIQAKILNYQNGKVKLQRKDGVIFVVPISIFDRVSSSIIENKAKEMDSFSDSANTSYLPQITRPLKIY